MRFLKTATVVLATWVASCTFATPDILKEFKGIYPEAKANCQTCHIQPPKRNPFGKEVQAALNTTSDGVLTKELMKTIESKDSDGDGVSNIDEIKAETGPGDPNSKPDQTTASPSPVPSDSKLGSNELVPKHSFHPALVHFPIALLAVAALLEIIAKRKGDSNYHNASVINLAIGLIAAVGAIITGVAAWLRLGYEIKGDLLIHLLLASSSVIFGLGAYFQRGKSTYLWLIALAGLLVMIAGHFGGNMVYGG